MLFVVEAGGGRWGSFRSDQTLDIARPWRRPSLRGGAMRAGEREREWLGLGSCLQSATKDGGAQTAQGRFSQHVTRVVDLCSVFPHCWGARVARGRRNPPPAVIQPAVIKSEKKGGAAWGLHVSTRAGRKDKNQERKRPGTVSRS